MSVQLGGVRDLIRADLDAILEVSNAQFEDALFAVLNSRLPASTRTATEDLLREYLHARLALTDDHTKATGDLWKLHLVDLGAAAGSIDDMVKELRGVGTSLFPVIP